MSLVRPAALVTLQVRFDDRRAEDDARVLRPRSPADRVSSLDDVDRAERALNLRRGELPPEEYAALRADLADQRARLTREATAAPGDPPEAIDGGSDDRVVLTGILPRSVDLQRNGLVTADQCTIELDYADAPFDPRTIRSAGVEVLLGLVSADDFAAGMRGETREDGSLRSFVERRLDAPAAPGSTRFVGVVDTWRGELDGVTDDRLTLTCRDLTALMLDTEMPRRAGVDLEVPIDRGIRDFLDGFPELRGFDVVFGVDGEEPIIPLDVFSPSRRSGSGRARRAAAADMKVWDYLSDLAVQLGFIATLEDYTIRIVRPRTFYASRTAARRMIYGRNLEKLSFERKLAGVKVPTVEVRAFDASTGKTRWARHPVRSGQPSAGEYPASPPRPSRANAVPPGGTGVEDKIKTFTLTGITGLPALAQAAETLWQQIGRQELEGDFETRDSWSYEAPPEEADLLNLRAGDAVEILVASQDAADAREALVTAGILEGLSVEARARYLERLGYRSSLATRLAELQEATGNLTTFRVDEVNLRFSQDDGISLRVAFRNFLTIEEPAPEEPATPPARARARRAPADAGASQIERDLARLQRLAAELVGRRERGEISDEEYQRDAADLQRVTRQLTQQARSQ